jgi:ABC-2 type transport system permease protein
MNPTLLRAELRRMRRNRGTLVAAAVLPVMFFLMFSSAEADDRIGDLAVAPYLMVSMATYGAMNALFTGSGIIAAERATGWSRQLRVAGLQGRDYVATKILVAYATATLGLASVFVVGATVRDVHLSAAEWVGATVSVLLSLLPVAALGVAVGYAARPQTLQPLFGIGSALLALAGGLLNPIENFPRIARDGMQLLPVYWAGDAGRAVLGGSWVGWHGVAVLGFWTLVLGALAARAYRRDDLRPVAAGTT